MENHIAIAINSHITFVNKSPINIADKTHIAIAAKSHIAIANKSHIPRQKLSSASPAILGALVKLKAFIGAFIPITLKVGYPAIIANTALMPNLIKFLVLLKAYC